MRWKAKMDVGRRRKQTKAAEKQWLEVKALAKNRVR